MNLSAEQRAKLMVSTRGAAIAFIEDLPLLRMMAFNQEHSPADLRRSSAVLRRLVVEEDLRQIAVPRIGKLHLRIPDYNQYYKSNQLIPIDYLGSAGEMTLVQYADAPMSLSRLVAGMGPPPGPHVIVQARLDTFQNQNIMCFKNQWVSRAEIIKFIANAMSGVHSEKSTGKHDDVIKQLRRCIRYARNEAGELNVTLMFDGSRFHDESIPIYDPDAVDPVLRELVTASELIEVAPVLRTVWRLG
jgi:hypothetical protein